MVDELNTEKAFDPNDSLKMLQGATDKMLEAARVQAVYGEPVRNGDTVLIPSAEVLSVLGIGFGAGSGKDDKGQPAGGAGGGGGGRVLSRPVAAIVVMPNRVRVEPIMDLTKIWMAGLTAAGFVFAMLARMSSRRAPRNEE